MRSSWSIVAAALGFILVLCFQRFGVDIFQWKLELKTYDLRQSLFQRPLSGPVVLGGIDEKSKDALGPFPWSRDTHALLAQDLFSRGAKGVFLDLIFDEERAEDQELEKALKTGYSVVAGTVTQVNNSLVPPIISPPLQSLPVGIINKTEDEDGILRSMWIAIGVNSSSWKRTPYLSAPFLLYLRTLGVDPKDVRFEVDGIPYDSVLPNVRKLPVVDTVGQVTVKDQVIPLRVAVNPSDDAVVFMLAIQFASPLTTHQVVSEKVVSYVDLPEQNVDGRFIFIGENTDSDVDIIRTPVGLMKGVEGHVQTYVALRDGHFLSQIKYPVAIFFAMAVFLGLILGHVHAGRAIALRCLSLVAVYGVCAVLFFRWGWWLPVAFPFIQVAVTGAILVLIRTEVARATFGRLTTKEAAAEMLVSQTGDELEATTVDATIIVSDIRGYTTLSETRTALQMLQLLNEYHTATVAIFEKFGGRALTYQGDAQLIVFGYPNKIKEPAKASVQAAVALQQAVKELKILWGVDDSVFSVGVACCTGSVAVGRLGAKGSQIQYTVIGDPVRRAHKIQSLSDQLGSPVLVDPPTAEQIGDRLALDDLGEIDVPGIATPLNLFRPKSLDDVNA